MLRLSIFGLLAAVLALPVSISVSTTAEAQARPATMMAQCRNRAHQILRTRLPNISTKFEGRRVDGTYAVNGRARVNRRVETFQCSFGRRGRRIVRFVVN